MFQENIVVLHLFRFLNLLQQINKLNIFIGSASNSWLGIGGGWLVFH